MSVMVRVQEDIRDKLLSLRDQMGFRNVANVVRFLLSERSIKAASAEKIMEKRVPVVVTGKPLAGKTYFIRNRILAQLKAFPVLVIDTWDEYKEIRQMSYEVHAIDFRNFKGHVRFVPTKRTDIAEREVERLFEDLDMKRDELSRWVLIVEEAHAYRNLPPFMKFLYGSRRIVRKMIVVTPQLDAFEGLETLSIHREAVDI